MSQFPACRNADLFGILSGRDLFPEGQNDLFLDKILDRFSVRRAGDEIDVCDLHQFSDDQFAAPVAVCENSHGLAFCQFGDFRRNVRAADADSVLDAVFKKVEDVGAAFHDDDVVRVVFRSGRDLVLSEESDVFDADGFSDDVGDLLRFQKVFIEKSGVDDFGAFDDAGAFDGADIFDFRDLDRGRAGADAVDRLQGCGQDGRLDFIQTGRDENVSSRFSGFRRGHDFNAADAAGLLEFPQIKIRSEKTFRLSENSADDIRAFNDAVC